MFVIQSPKIRCATSKEDQDKQWNAKIVGHIYIFIHTLILTLRCPGSQGAVFINEVIESEGQDEEGAVTGCVHLEGHIPLVKANCLAFLGQRRLEKFSTHLRKIIFHLWQTDSQSGKLTDRRKLSYLTPKQETFAHVGHPDHEAGSTFVGGHHSMLAKLHRLASLLRPSHLSGEGFDLKFLKQFLYNCVLSI